MEQLPPHLGPRRPALPLRHPTPCITIHRNTQFRKRSRHRDILRFTLIRVRLLLLEVVRQGVESGARRAEAEDIFIVYAVVYGLMANGRRVVMLLLENRYISLC